jgi:pantoate--beta-alanine ligase
MRLLPSIPDLRAWRGSAPAPVVFVPTMGALHEGHLQLMRDARGFAGEEGSVIVSIFVNPLQFGPKEDFSKYPRELEADAAKCRSVGVDAIFAPGAEEMYSPDRSVTVLETSLSQVLCGASRPGHFDGVCTVVLKLFNLVQPQRAMFGKKDYQQLAIIRRMVRDLNVPIEITGSETVREADGLAMSSRNRYLSELERKQAPAIRRALLLAKTRWESGETSAAALREVFLKELRTQAPLSKVDYIECVDAGSLETVGEMRGSGLMAAAVFFGKTRLIDNVELLL